MTGFGPTRRDKCFMSERINSASFIGVDLAWSDNNPSGLAHLVFDGEVARFVDADRLIADEEIISWVRARELETTWLGIDGPIIAPNPAKTSRIADNMVTSCFGRYHAGVYPGNRERCARPIRLCEKLVASGFSPDPFLHTRTGKRQLEISPHLAQIALFGRKTIIKYKKGSVEQKQNGLRLFQRAIATLTNQHPPLNSSRSLLELLNTNPRFLRGRNLKALEDKLDAVLCAYMTLYFWRWGEARCAIYGDLKGGYIIGPKEGFDD